MRINLRHGNILVAEQTLYGTDVITILQQMRGKTVAESVWHVAGFVNYAVLTASFITRCTLVLFQ
jgi:hypothetical protein